MVINVSLLLEVFQGFTDLFLNLQGWITLDDPVLVSIIQNQLHLLVYSSLSIITVALSLSARTSTILSSLMRF